MRVLISADAEGITGIFKKSQVTPGRPDYGQLRSLIVHDVNAVIRGMFAGGATKMVVSSNHNYNNSILLVDLDSRASLMSGTDGPLIMIEGLTEQVDALMLMGYHSREEAESVISHTYYYLVVVDATTNGVPFEEAEFMSHVAGYYGIPTMLFTGNDCVTVSAEKQIPGIHTAVTKKVIDNGGAQLYHPEKAGKLIEEVAKAAASEYRTIAPAKLEGSTALTIAFAAATQVVHACKVPGFTLSKEQDNAVSCTYDDYLEPYKAFLDVLWQATTFSDQC